MFVMETNRIHRRELQKVLEKISLSAKYKSYFFF